MDELDWINGEEMIGGIFLPLLAKTLASQN